MQTENHLLMVELLIEQYKRDPALRGFIAAQLFESQQIEESAQEVAQSRDLDVATGAALDLFGIFLGQPRNGLSDDLYRIFLKARVLVNLGNGRGEEILDLLKQTVPSGGTFSFYEMYPAGFFVRLYGIDADSASAIAGLVCKIKGAGIGCTVSLTPDPPAGFFYGVSSPGFGSTNSSAIYPVWDSAATWDSSAIWVQEGQIQGGPWTGLA